MPTLACQHWLELDHSGDVVLECRGAADHSGKHWDELWDVQAVGPRPEGGASRKRVTARVEWDR